MSLKKIPFLLLISVQLSIAQNFVPTDTLFINSITQQQGLSQLNAKAMEFDGLGYLWVGTEDGLNRFNGYEFKTYLHDPADSTSIKDDHIRDLLYAGDTLWMATNSGGIDGFIPSKNRFIHLMKHTDDQDLLTGYNIFDIGRSALLFAVGNNLILFDRNTRKTKIIKLPKGQNENHVTAVTGSGKTTFWLATTGTGVLELDTKTLKITKTRFFNDLPVQCFYRQGPELYIGTKNGLGIYHENTKEFQYLKTGFSVKCFYKKDNDRFYLGTDNGLYQYNTKKASLTNLVLKDQNSKNYKIFDINQIKGDQSGNLWIGTEGRGLFHYNRYKKKFNTLKLALNEYPLIESVSPFQFLKEKDSTLWIGCKYGLVKYSHPGHRFKLYQNTRGNLIYTIIRDRENTIWAGGFTTGLLKYDKNSDRFKKITAIRLPDEDVIEIIPVTKNTLWLCTWAGGIYVFDIRNEAFVELIIDQKRISRARTSLIDSKENIWLGTDYGIYKVDKNGNLLANYTQNDSDKSLSSNRIFTIKEDRRGNIWAGTNAGLTKIDAQSGMTSKFSKQEGLPNDFIYSLLIDKQERIWVSTNYGISVLDPVTLKFKNYTINDGLQNNEFNGKAGYKDKYDNFYFGGISGINIFNPDHLHQNSVLPRVYIESVDLFNKPINKNELYKDKLQLKSHENVITLNYVALNYLNPEKTNYTFKLEGFDDQWRPFTKDLSTTYTNLDPGNYTFMVKGTNDAGIWNEKPATMQLTILPPWYRTKAFKGILILLFLLSGPLFYFYKTKKLKKDKAYLEQIVLERTHELALKNRNLKQVNNEIEKQHDRINFLMREMTHRIKNNLQIISSLLNIQANAMEHKPAADAIKIARNRILAISHIENKTSTGDKAIQIDTFIKELTNSIVEALSDGSQLKFKIKYNLQKTKIRHMNTTLIGLILNELITNTIKYAFDDYHPGNYLEISCKLEHDSLKLIVRDNGKGYTLEKDLASNSLGIELVTEMVNQLGGTIAIHSKNGTENIIDIPV